MWLPLPSTHSHPRILTPPPPPSPLTTPPSSAHVHSYTASLTLFRRSYYFRHSNVRIVGGLDTQGNGAVAETALGGGAGNRVQKQNSFNSPDEVALPEDQWLDIIKKLIKVQVFRAPCFAPYAQTNPLPLRFLSSPLLCATIYM